MSLNFQHNHSKQIYDVIMTCEEESMLLCVPLDVCIVCLCVCVWLYSVCECVCVFVWVCVCRTVPEGEQTTPPDHTQ